MRRIVLTLLALVAASPAIAEMNTVSPGQIGEIFCVSRLGNDDAILTGVLTDELRTLIDYSDARDAVFAAANPGDKPPLGDGVQWQSFPDYAANCEIGSIVVEGKVAKVVVKYGFPEAPSADYTDTLVLNLVAHHYDPDTGIWRLDDVLYTSAGGLKQALASAFSE